jgi:hypothetical protein
MSYDCTSDIAVKLRMGNDYDLDSFISMCENEILTLSCQKKHPVLSSSEKVKSIRKVFNCKNRNKIPSQLF